MDRQGREGAESEMLPGFSQESRVHTTAQLAPQFSLSALLDLPRHRHR